MFVWIYTGQRQEYRNLVRWLSRSGDGYVYLAFSLLIWLFETTYGFAFFVSALFAFAIEVSAYLILKNVIRRNRPQASIQGLQALITPSDKFSFPSGHTGAAFVFATLIIQFYPLWTLTILIWAILIGASRVLLGVHYPGDILAGATLGIGSALLGLSIAQYTI